MTVLFFVKGADFSDISILQLMKVRELALGFSPVTPSMISLVSCTILEEGLGAHPEEQNSSQAPCHDAMTTTGGLLACCKFPILPARSCSGVQAGVHLRIPGYALSCAIDAPQRRAACAIMPLWACSAAPMEDLLDMIMLYACPSSAGLTAARLLDVSTKPATIK